MSEDQFPPVNAVTSPPKKEGFEARLITPSVGAPGAIVEDADHREVAVCHSLAMAELIAEALNGQAEPGARTLETAEPPAHRSVEELSGNWVERHCAGLNEFNRPHAYGIAFEAGLRMAIGPTARRLADEACRWAVASDAASFNAEAQDRILERVLGPAGAELAWPPAASTCPSFGEVAEIAVWLVSDCVQTERAWKDRGVADQKPEEWEFIQGRLRVYRRAADHLRALALAVLGQQAEAIEQTRMIRAGLEDIHAAARPGSGPRAAAEIRERAADMLGKIGPPE